MGRLLKDDSGFALLLTILIVSLIVAVTLQFNTSMRSELHAAANLKDAIKLSCIARSGLNGVLAVLSEDERSVDTLHEDWANTEALSAYSSAIFEEGSFKVLIIDHSGRIQINGLYDASKKDYNDTQKLFLKRFLEYDEFGLESDEIDEIISAIKDWIDGDHDETGIYGAEDSYYQTLERPYYCRNAPLESLEELLLVKGITKELFYGTKEKPGISYYLTVHGSDGKININTADCRLEELAFERLEKIPRPPLILMTLSEYILGTDMVGDWKEYREEEKGDLSLYTKYPGLSGLTGDQGDKAKALLTTKGAYFEIQSEGFKEAMSKQVTAMVEMGQTPGQLKILSWKVE
jgi:general secretion pathway protein K